MERVEHLDEDLVDLGAASEVTQGSLNGFEDVIGGNEPAGLSND